LGFTFKVYNKIKHSRTKGKYVLHQFKELIPIKSSQDYSRFKNKDKYYTNEKGKLESLIDV